VTDNGYGGRRAHGESETGDDPISRRLHPASQRRDQRRNHRRYRAL